MESDIRINEHFFDLFTNAKYKLIIQAVNEIQDPSDDDIVHKYEAMVALGQIEQVIKNRSHLNNIVNPSTQLRAYAILTRAL
ncbi:MAG: hypothetical protein IH840_05675 [Candidatus Heimdallarchaeota archaeon]|nr:hypothetical protein [Candidatus Heimdallarchaeota archaeon]